MSWFTGALMARILQLRMLQQLSSINVSRDHFIQYFLCLIFNYIEQFRGLSFMQDGKLSWLPHTSNEFFSSETSHSFSNMILEHKVLQTRMFHSQIKVRKVHFQYSSGSFVNIILKQT